MTEPAFVSASVEANGHPVECQEPASGEVVSTTSHGISVTVNGNTHELASVDSADISVPSHAHDYTSTEGCHDMQSHTLDPSGEPSITVNGSPIYVVEDNVSTDPGSGGTVDITNNPQTTGLNIL